MMLANTIELPLPSIATTGSASLALSKTIEADDQSVPENPAAQTAAPLPPKPTKASVATVGLGTTGSGAWKMPIMPSAVSDPLAQSADVTSVETTGVVGFQVACVTPFTTVPGRKAPAIPK